MTKVSICIPNYNKAKYVGNAIQSALNQTFEDLEVIVIDNCSTDNSWEIINSFSDSRLMKIRNTENVGMVGNFELALSRATGEYRTFLSSDDMLFPDAIQKLFSMLSKESGVAYVFGNIEYSGNRIGNTNYNFKDQFSKEEFFRMSLLNAKNFVFLTGTLFRKEVKFQFPDLLFFDWFNWLSLAMDNKVLFLNDLVGTHHYYAENETRIQAGQLLVEYKQLDMVLIELGSQRSNHDSLITTSRKRLARKYWRLFIQQEDNINTSFNTLYSDYKKNVFGINVKDKLLYLFDFRYAHLRKLL